METNVETTATKKVLYTGRTHTTGGRDGGSSQSSDGVLDVKLSVPGKNEGGTNPEQLFAAGWSACFIGALKIAAAKMNVKYPDNASVDAEVDLTSTGGQYALQARLQVNLPGMDARIARNITDEAHKTCPYSKATRSNIAVVLAIRTAL